jgi:formate-dependent phosphoribosylglycinamide formyltransferase (GAR transformylase)
MSNRTIICLGAGSNQLPLIHEARNLGFKVVAVDRNPLSPGMAVADVTIVESTHDADAVIAHLRKHGNSYHGILARTCGTPLITAAKICETFGIAGITASLAKLAIQKSSLRAFAAIHGIPMPSGWLNDLPAEEIQFPLIVKPDLTVIGKKDVVLVNDSAALEYAITAARQSSDMANPDRART